MYLLLSLPSQLLRFALFKVIHDHHGGIDLTHCHVCVCEETHTNMWFEFKSKIHCYRNENQGLQHHTVALY